MIPETINWQGECPGFARLIEQTRLPLEDVVLDVKTVPDMVDAIYRLAVRGAPAIGVAAGFGVMLGIQDQSGLGGDAMLAQINETAATLAKARPTAVNLFWALERMKDRARRDHATGLDGDGLRAGQFEEGQAIWNEDRSACKRMGEIGAELIKDGDTLLTHCNAGALATAGQGTALSPMYEAHAQGKRIQVFADETRPLLQGARLTTWELMRAGIDVTLITDSTAGRVFFEGKIDAVFVGSDRIAGNGDVCNKIGTYSVAVLAHEHNVPFYVVAPISTIDPTLADGGAIPIEERPAEEVTEGFGTRTAPPGCKVYAPAFDVTPARLVTGIITEVGLIEQPDTAKILEAVDRKGAFDLRASNSI